MVAIQAPQARAPQRAPRLTAALGSHGSGTSKLDPFALNLSTGFGMPVMSEVEWLSPNGMGDVLACHP
jgi:hypothetical protein